jgi:hypothetical protein
MNASIGLYGQYLVSTGVGLEWSNQLVSNTPIIVPASMMTYTNSQPPSFSVVVFNSIAYDGWFYQNYRTGINIGWNMYLTNGTYPSTIQYNTNSIKQMYVCFISTVSSCSIGLNVYTSPLPPEDPLTAPAFYKSRFGAVLREPSVDISLNKPYIAYYDFSGNTYPAPTKFLHTPLQMMPSTVNASGDFYNETLNYFSVCSNTASVTDADSFIVSEAGFIMKDGTQQPFRQPYLFQSASIQPLNPYSVQQVLTGNTIDFNISNLGYTFIATSYTTALTITTLITPAASSLSVNTIQNGVFTIYNSKAVSVVITYNGSSTYPLLAGKAVSFVWVGGTTNLLRLQ